MRHERKRYLQAALSAPGRLQRGIRGFLREEDGAGLIVFALVMLLLMLAAAGIAVDTMRFETQRTRLQNTADAAVLAAASLTQVRDPEEVVRDYFDKAGLGAYVEEVVVYHNELNARDISVTARAPMQTILMRLAGVNQLTVPSTSRAVERANVEISLVLDLSGSMNSPASKLRNLKDAASEFVDMLLANDTTGQIAISLVPYTGQVNAGQAILSRYNVSHAHDLSHCVDFDGADFRTTELSTYRQLTGYGHGMPYELFNFGGVGGLPPTYLACPTSLGNDGIEIMGWQTDANALKSRIAGMEAQGSTAIDIGMKWGAALVDPSMRPVVADLISAGELPEEYDGRPFEHDDPETMKVVVLMTDGAHENPEMRISDAYKSGPSNVWVNPNDDPYGNATRTYSVYDPQRQQFRWRRDSTWRDYPYGNQPVETCEQQYVCTAWNWWGQCTRQGWQNICTVTGHTGPAVNLSYPELFNRATFRTVQTNLYSWAGLSTSNWANQLSASTKDARLRDICDAARDSGIVVYTVAFEAPTNGRTLLRNCASEPEYFFDVRGLEITEAFRDIAYDIMKLRLTQ